jgi:hypothetical protein
MLEQVKQQQNAYEEIYAPEQKSEFDFHITTDPLTRYLRDRRLLKALAVLEQSNTNIRRVERAAYLWGCWGRGFVF